MNRTLKGNILITILVIGFMMSLLLIPAVSTVSRLMKVQGITSNFVAEEEALSSGIDYARYLIANEMTQGVLSLPQGTVEVVMNVPNTVGNVYEYYDVMIVYRPKSSANVVWTVKLVKDTVTLSSWAVSIEGGGR